MAVRADLLVVLGGVVAHRLLLGLEGGVAGGGSAVVRAIARAHGMLGSVGRAGGPARGRVGSLGGGGGGGGLLVARGACTAAAC